jgi:uncharacterized protein
MAFKDNYSKGCKACQNGKWLCIFLTYQCNAACTFCPAPFKNRDLINSALGNDPSTILGYLELYPFEGISFSGGECFIVYDRMLSWLDFFKKNQPQLYYWAYTNGIDIKKEQLVDLKNAGLNELRFNIAASGYNDPLVLESIADASEIFEHVTVEIPSIPDDFEKLIKTIPLLEKMRVDYLNLHEYLLVAGDPNSKNAPAGRFLMNLSMPMDYHQKSLLNTEKISSFCAENDFNIKINNCSLMKKEHQMYGRRITMGTLFKEDHEKLTKDGFLETIFSPGRISDEVDENLSNYHRADRSYFIHPDHFTKTGSDAYLLKIMPKLGVNDHPRVIEYTKLT